MRTTICTMLAMLLAGGDAQPASLSDQAGLELTLAADGTITAVDLHGNELGLGGYGGFYLREPNSDIRTPLVGQIAARDRSCQLAARNSLHAKLDASWIEGDGYIEIRGELTDLTGADRGLWLGFNVPLDATGWKWGKSLSYRREHFADVDHPLTFDQEGRVCIHTKLTHDELFDALRKQGRDLGLLHEAAGMKVYGWSKQPNRPAGHQNDGRFFTAALVAGGWHEGSFKPIEMGGMDFERMVLGRKSYRISSGNIVAQNEPPTLERVKRALAQTTAYGFACPVQIQYFYTPDRPGYSDEWSWINKPEHKELWEKYEPANLAIRLAGWEPVTHAVADSKAVQIERFGRGEEIYFTVWGPDPPDTATIEIDSAALGLSSEATFREIVDETKIQDSESSKGWKLTLPMERDMTRVIRIQSAVPTN